LYNSGAISEEEAIAKANECLDMHNAELDGCSNELWRCRGLPRPPTQRFSASQKNKYNHSANHYNKAAGVLGFAAVTAALLLYRHTAIGAAVGFFFGAFALGCVLHGVDLSDLAIDPPDPDYDNISQPEPPTPPIIAPNAELSASLATKLNAVLTNQAQSAGLGRAVVTAINKASAAEAANHLQARDRQLTASRGFATEWASVFERAAPLRRNAATHFGQAFGRSPISAMDAIGLRSEILASGWPKVIVDMCDQYGISGQRQEEVFRTMTSRLADLSALTVSFPDLIAAAFLSRPEKQVVEALREFASQ
jgi:hypothetical protein